MTDKRPFPVLAPLALLPLALLAACDREPAEEGAATGEVLEGTVSDAMLPLDRVRSEPPLEDPEAFAQVQEKAAAAGGAAAVPASEAGAADDAETADAEDPPAAEPPPESGD
jgi:hypothetical protein